MKWTLLSLVVVASAAQAQTISPFMIGLPNDTTSTELPPFGPSECNSTLTLQWTYQISVGIPCSPLSLWATESDCGDAAATGDVSYDQVLAATLISAHQGPFDVAISKLPGFAATAGTCGAAGITKTHKICGAVSTAYDCNVGNKTVQRARAFSLTYDSQPPAPPAITSLAPLDTGLRVDFSVDADTVTVEAWAKGPADADFTMRKDVPAANGTVRLTGLANGDTYEVKLLAIDAANNASDFSEAWSGTPIHSIGFWEAYRRGGGSDPGGCAVAPGLPLLALALLLRRRRT